jgi:NADP-dependent 3-hydroxy acid dehydrogenase YdfG
MGESAGIGAEVGKQLAANGSKVVLAARRKNELDAIAKGIGERALAVVADVTKRRGATSSSAPNEPSSASVASMSG